MATYVLVHGGGHGGWCYKKVKRRLEAAATRFSRRRWPGWRSARG